MPVRALPVLALGAWALPAPAPHAPALCRALGLRRRLEGAASEVWLTFDDGPHRRGTPAVLESLAAAGARATFFLVGEQVARDPALAAEIALAGHGIGVHGHTHRGLLRLGPRALSEDLLRAEDALARATGKPLVHHRAPYGVYSLAALREVRARGWRPVLWSRWGRDWRARATPESVAADVAERARPGDILLLHDSDAYSAPGSWHVTAEALPRVLDTLGERALRTTVPCETAKCGQCGADRRLSAPAGAGWRSSRSL